MQDQPQRSGRRARRGLRGTAVALVAGLIVSACAGGAASPSPVPAASEAATPAPPASATPAAPATATPPLSGALTLYTSVTQNTVDAIVAGFAEVAPEVGVEVFRAPTGELAARIAAEIREGGLQADVLWLTDPLSMAEYEDQGLLLAWEPAGAASLDPAYRGTSSWGTRLLNVVMVRGADVSPAPAAWKELTDGAYRDAVALPDPAFAGSAFGALGYFALAPGYGLDFYRALEANGATQLRAPDEVTTGVAEGRFAAGMTLDNSVRTAVAKGSPIELVWPTDGAVAIDSPIAVVEQADAQDAARAFVEHVLSEAGQAAIGSTGWQPVRPGVGGPEPEGPQVTPDWDAAIARRDELLAEYREIFGG